MIISEWKAEFDRTMEQIWQSIAETQRILDDDDEPRDRHLSLVPPLEEGDDGQRQAGKTCTRTNIRHRAGGKFRLRTE